MTKIYGSFVKDTLVAGGYRRCYIDIPDHAALKLFTDIGIPTQENPIPVYIIPAQQEGDDHEVQENIIE